MERYLKFVIAMTALGWAIGAIFGTSAARRQPTPVPATPTHTPVPVVTASPATVVPSPPPLGWHTPTAPLPTPLAPPGPVVILVGQP